MSYKTYGSGPNSRNAQFVIHQCVAMLYALRCAFIVHCLDQVHDTNVELPEQLSTKFLNSSVNSNFTAIQNIKRPGKMCIPDHYGQSVTWTCTAHTALVVHTGPLSLGRLAVSHAIIKETFNKIFCDILKIIEKMKVPIYVKHEFDALHDSTTCSTPGQGLLTFNRSPWAEFAISSNYCTDYQKTFVESASKVYRMCLAAMHLSGGPSPRGTEEAVTRLHNSETELIRNVYLVDGTIGVRAG